MKLHGLLAFIFGTVGFARLSRSSCLLRNAKPNVYWYQCFRTDNYLADVERAPIDVDRVTFGNSNIKIVLDRSFDRLSKNLARLGFFYCGTEEIENNAFQGLTELEFLAVTGGKLQVIKGAWFEGLSKLRVVSFQNNQIKHIEDSFFSTSPLQVVDISSNKITCLPIASLTNFKVKELYFQFNRLTWMCQDMIIDWLKGKNIETGHHFPEYKDAPYELIKMCSNKLPKSYLDEESFNKCIENRTSELLPNRENYTIKQFCEFLEKKPSPFLDCNED
ncbi:matrix-remodeling-associated protein 5-like [Neodiprion virginianus]|uniref:matrix-remodeling-associated protein 5-like n=1 Tax=Neodiprion virginianus TaxID=2961670 RepID=UPI001EE6B117|nr:matrix-remodeling-associated protein 5-like [Neodiprion virginianus]